MHLYNANNNVLATVGYTYTGDRLQTIAAPGTTYTFSYDALGRSTKLQIGSRVLASYAYLPSELLDTLTYGNGAKVSYRYDGLGRQIEKAFGDDGTQVLQTTYNDRGQVGLIRDSIADTHTRYTYDLAGRVIGIQKLRGKATAPDAQLGAVEYVYEDGTARLKSQKTVTPFGEDTLTLTYGSLANGTSPDRVAYINGSHFGQINYLYDDLGRLDCRNLWDAHLFTNYTYEDIGTSGRTTTRISSVTSGGTTLNYTYDADGRIKTVKNGDTLVESYTYDTFGRLSTAFGPSVMSAYSYDTNGNLTEKNEKGVTTTYAYTDSTWGDLLTNYNGTLLYYDQIGNPLYWRDGMTMGWRNGRQLAYVGRVGTEKKTTYAYGADGVRTQKTVDGVTTEYYTVGGKLLAEKTGDQVLTFYYDDRDRPVSVELNGIRYYYRQNLQGDVIGLYSGGAQVVSYTYDPWGKLLNITDTSGTNIGALNPLRYRGYYYDTETGFYFLQSRYYDPTVGRFINVDGYISTGQGISSYNMFAYCGNDPVNHCDPTGHAREWALLGFSYDGSARDFWRMEHGLAPYAYEQWLAVGGKRTVNRSRTNSGVTVTLKSATYVPASKTKDYYIEKARPLTTLQTSTAVSEISGAIVSVAGKLGYEIPYVGGVLGVLGGIAFINDISLQTELSRYETAMNQGTGVLIVTWDVEGARCVHSSFEVYYSWDGGMN